MYHAAFFGLVPLHSNKHFDSPHYRHAVMHCNASKLDDHAALHLVTIDGATKTSCRVVKLVHKSWKIQEKKEETENLFFCPQQVGMRGELRSRAISSYYTY